MKAITIIFLAITVSFSQVKGQQAFKNAAIARVNNHYRITYSVPSEANIYQYRIEAGNDTTDMEVTGVVKPVGNSVTERSYSYDVYDGAYKYYRVAAISMGSKLKYSKILNIPAIELKHTPKNEQAKPVETNILASGNR